MVWCSLGERPWTIRLGAQNKYSLRHNKGWLHLKLTDGFEPILDSRRPLPGPSSKTCPACSSNLRQETTVRTVPKLHRCPRNHEILSGAVNVGSARTDSMR